MNFKETDTLNRVCDYLVARSRQMGIEGFSIKGEGIEIEDAMDQDGPLTWALFLHANIISRMGDIKGMPFECVTDPDSLFGNRGGIQKGASTGALALGCSLPFIDGALEHAVVVGIRDLGCSREEWMALPDGLRVLPVESYFDDLRAHWVSQEFEFGSVAERVLLWPVIHDFASYSESLALEQKTTHHEDLKINRIVPFTPKQ